MITKADGIGEKNKSSSRNVNLQSTKEEIMRKKDAAGTKNQGTIEEKERKIKDIMKIHNSEENEEENEGKLIEEMKIYNSSWSPMR